MTAPSFVSCPDTIPVRLEEEAAASDSAAFTSPREFARKVASRQPPGSFREMSQHFAENRDFVILQELKPPCFPPLAEPGNLARG